MGKLAKGLVVQVWYQRRLLGVSGSMTSYSYPLSPPICAKGMIQRAICGLCTTTIKRGCLALVVAEPVLSPV